MAAHCNNSDSTSQYPPFCCVHGSESQPLLGHHPHPHLSQQQSRDGDCRVDVHDEKTSHDTRGPCPSNSKKIRRRKFWGRVCSLVVLGWVYYTFVHNGRGSHDHGHHGHHLDIDSDVSSQAGTYGTCAKATSDWNSTLSTDAQNLRLRFGKGRFGSHVQVYQGDVSIPTILVKGKITPWRTRLDAKLDSLGPEIDENQSEVENLGLHLEIKNDLDQLEVFIWFKDRDIVEHGETHHACAKLDIDIILPNAYQHYGTITIDGGVTTINTHDLGGIGFQKLELGTNVGDVVTQGVVLADKVLVHTLTGKATLEALEVATEDTPLNVEVSTRTGSISVGAKTTFLNDDNIHAHKVITTASTGSIKVHVSPAAPEVPSGKKAGDLEITAHTNTGAVGITTQLADKLQSLVLSAMVNTGSVDAAVSDEFTGHFDVSTVTGSAKVQETTGSTGVIVYNRQTATQKAGTRIHDGDRGQSSILLSTRTGHASLTFTS
ncbi:hypothetical protein BGZ99_003670 [Dissophora globulifera]|uniref:Adhesin domain-containing protein n=1 Tax=Dissophora globulifera TaxID=979702 RepID=A0A9P6RTM9_9FUNG|nr:hypothetical protein BGZ99_003670 [Dissophora globulifera]